jgi:protein involved in polysaccharide export with SLBB domain
MHNELEAWMIRQLTTMSLAVALLLTPLQPAGAQQNEPQVFVTGWVEKPGPFTYANDQTVGSVIEAAGGLRRAMAGEALRAYVVRTIDGKPTSCLATLTTPTKPNDIITVTEIRAAGPTCDARPK